MAMTTRRTFLRNAACGVAAAAVGCARPGADSTAASGRRRLHLTTSSNHFKSLTIEDACARVAGLGFEAVDLWSAYKGCPHLDDAAARLGGAGLRALLAKHRLGLAAFSVYVGGYPKYAEILGRAGGGLAIHGSAEPAKPGELTVAMKSFLEGLEGELELAEKHDSRLAIENHGNALLDSPDSFKAFTDLNRNPRLGIALAPYHLQAIGAPVEEAIAIAGRQLFFYYAWQGPAGAGELPGHGPADFAPWLAALDRTGYEGPVNVFTHHEREPDAMSAALAKSRDYLRGVQLRQ